MRSTTTQTSVSGSRPERRLFRCVPSATAWVVALARTALREARKSIEGQRPPMRSVPLTATVLALLILGDLLVIASALQKNDLSLTEFVSYVSSLGLTMTLRGAGDVLGEWLHRIRKADESSTRNGSDTTSSVSSSDDASGPGAPGEHTTPPSCEVCGRGADGADSPVRPVCAICGQVS